MGRQKHVNSVDIADAIRLGCRTMQNIFNADDHLVCRDAARHGE